MELKEKIKEIYNEKMNHKYLLKNKIPRRGNPVIFTTKHGKYAYIYYIYATYDKERNMWTGHSGITDGVEIEAHPDDMWWEYWT